VFDLEDDGQMSGLVDCIRFAPDGSIDDDSLQDVVIRQGVEALVRIRLSDNGLNYEIEENNNVR